MKIGERPPEFWGNMKEGYETHNKDYALAITADGEYYLEQDKLDPNDFEKKLREANEREPARRLVLRGDIQARYADVRKMFRICQKIGFPGISLRANQREITEGDKKRTRGSK